MGVTESQYSLSIIGMFLLIPWMKNKLTSRSVRNHKRLLLLLIWLLWRLQETIQADSQWTEYVPYLCNVTNTVHYVLEAVMLYTTCYISLNRYRAVSNPIMYRVSHTTGYTQIHAAVCGCIIGILCSVINITATQLLSADEYTGAYCRLTTPTNEEQVYLEGIIVVKSISLTIMYIVPCSYMIITNASMAVMLHKQKRRAAKMLQESTQQIASEEKINEPSTSSSSLQSA